MSEKFSFFTVPANQTPPKAFLEAVLKKYPSFMIGVQECGKDKPLIISELVDKPTIEDLDEYLANTTADLRVIGCYNSDRDLTADEIQPYPILVEPESGTPAMVVFMDGAFEQFEKAKSALPNSYHAAFNYLKPQVELLCGEFEDDFDKVLEHFASTDGGKELEGDLFGGQRGAVAFVYPGVVEGFQCQNDLALKADWGDCSDHCGHGQPIKAASRFAPKGDAKPAEPEKKPSRFAPKETPAVAPKPTEPSPSTSTEPAGKWLRPKVTVTGNGNLKEWYWSVSGMDAGSEIPKPLWDAISYKQGIFIPQAQFERIKSKDIMKKTDVVEKPGSRDHTQSVATPDTKPTGTNTRPKHIGTEVSPEMGADEKSKTLKLFTEPGIVKDLLEAAEAKPLTGEEAAEKLKKHTDWYNALKDGVKGDLNLTMSFPYWYYEELGSKSMESLAKLAWTNAMRCLQAESQAIAYAAIIAKDHGTTGIPVGKGPRAETLTAPKPSRFAPKAAKA